ncbi:hypothetical protein [Streptomyces griseoruber]|uniref:hypothetical protein n=1 Tax=Streptomyces griseoruber TaxID=1943 RepID=UPI0012FEDBAA|nr:hypothetical protein [Streptomyces griseoruber]
MTPHHALLPEDTTQVLAACGQEVAGLEHVSVQAHALPGPIIGIYVRAATQQAAVEAAEETWLRARIAHPRLLPWELLGAEVPELPPLPFRPQPDTLPEEHHLD